MNEHYGMVQVGTVLEEQENCKYGVISNVVNFSAQPTYERYDKGKAYVSFENKKIVTISFPDEEWVQAIWVSKYTRIAKKDNKIILLFEGYSNYFVDLPENTIKTEAGKPINTICVYLYESKKTKG